MNIKTILQRSWQLVWHYRALWIFGMVLALTTTNTIYFGTRQDVQNQPINNKIKFTDTFIISWPGDGLILDLTTPADPKLIFTDGSTARDFRFLTDWIKPLHRSDFIAIAIAILVLAVLIKLIATIARYVIETAVIRMVNETEATGRQLTLRQGLRLGWSSRAARLFLIDLLMGLVIAGVLALVLPVSIGSIMLVGSFGFFAILLVAIGIAGLLVFTGILLTGIGALVSFIMQTVRRACVVDNMGVFASIGMGINLLRYHFKEVGITWLIWIGIRILWAPMSLVVVIILAPVLLVFLLAGFAVGAVPAVLVTALVSPFVNGITSWIIGAIVGIPFLFLVTITPLLFVGGLVELYKSNMWTLAYRELRAMEHTVQAVQPRKPLAPAQGVVK